MADDDYRVSGNSAGLPTTVKSIVGIVLSDEMAGMIALVVESRKIEAEFRHRIERITNEYEALSESHDKMRKDRDGDREATMTTMKLMAECGMQDKIPEVYKEYLARAPRYSDDVVNIILNRK